MLRLCDLRHCVHRRQERHSISAATPSIISTVTPSPMIASLVGRFMIKTLHEKGPGLLPGRRPHLVGGPEIRLSRSGAMADPSRKMANRSGNAQLGILPSGGSPPDLCKAERRLSFQWVGLCKRCLRKFFAYAPVVAARPLLCAQIHTWGGGGPEGAWNCGFRARLTSGRCRGQEKDGQSFWQCAMGNTT